MRQCPDVALSSPCVQAVRESPLPHSEPDVLIKRLDPGVPLPSYAHPGDAGADLVTAEDVELGPGERALVRTGLAIALPDGYAAFVHPRSGLAARHGVTLVNAPGPLGQLQARRQNRAACHPAGGTGGLPRGHGASRVEPGRWRLRLDWPRPRGCACPGGTTPRDPPASPSGGTHPPRPPLGGKPSPPDPLGPPGLTQKERAECFVGVVQQTRVGSGPGTAIRSCPTTSSITASRSTMRRRDSPLKQCGRRAAPGTLGRPSPRSSGWTLAACRCRSGPSTRSSS